MQQHLMRNIRSFCVLVSADQPQLRSTLEDLITADPLFLDALLRLPLRRKGGESKGKKFDKRKEEGREKETGGYHCLPTTAGSR